MLLRYGKNLNLKLPDELRPALKDPFGELFKDGAEAVKKALNSSLDYEGIVSVGDVTTYHLLTIGITPSLCIVDGKVMRKKADGRILEKIEDAKLKSIEVENPSGMITDELKFTIKKYLQAQEKVIIEVKGEEDLATLPAIFYAPYGYIVMYGQPTKGVVRVKINKKNKQKAKKIIKKMEEV